MKKLILLNLVLSVYFFSACEDEVTVDLAPVEPYLAVDAFLTNQPGTQQIVLTYTQPYFEQGRPAAVDDALVNVVEQETGMEYSFIYNPGTKTYEWTPENAEDGFGEIGNSYVLRISMDGVDYVASSKMNDVPPIDSITFEYTRDAFVKGDYYVGEFWAKDLPGNGDTYWIKTWKNGEYLNRPSEILTAYDAGGGVGADVDNVIFIPPIRFGINPYDEDEDGSMMLPTYEVGDSAYVAIHSITSETYFFLGRVANETDRPGGFAELFSDPLGSIPTNIATSEQGVRVVGFFNTAAVSSLGERVDEETIRDKIPD